MVVEHRAVVRARVEDAFDLSQSYGLRLEWDPFVRAQRLVGAITAGKGVRTWTRSRHGLTMVTEYLTFRRPTLVGMKMIDGPWFFDRFSGAWHFTDGGDGSCEVLYRYQFTTAPRWLRWLMHPIGRWLLTRDIKARLDAFARAVEQPTMIDRLHAEQQALESG